MTRLSWETYDDSLKILTFFKKSLPRISLKKWCFIHLKNKNIFGKIRKQTFDEKDTCELKILHVHIFKKIVSYIF